MPKKNKKANPSNTPKKGEKIKNRRHAQPPPQLPDSDMEALGLNDDEPHLRDVMKMLGNITTKLATHKVQMDNISSHVAPREW